MDNSARNYQLKKWQVVLAFFILIFFVIVAFLSNINTAVAFSLIIGFPIGFLYNFYLSSKGFGRRPVGFKEAYVIEPKKATIDDRRSQWGITLVIFLVICYFVYMYFLHK